MSCYILMGTLNEHLSNAEAELLRAYCDRAYLSLRPGSARFFFPIVLTRGSLSVDRFADEHPGKWSKSNDVINSLALESCRRELGLLGVVPYEADGRIQPRISWRQRGGASGGC